MSYYPYAQSVSPPTEAPEPEESLSNTTRSTTDRAYSGLSPHTPFHHTAPSSGAIPSGLGDPVKPRTASQSYPTRPNITSLASGQPSSLSPYQPSRHSDRSASSSFSREDFGRRKQHGAPLPPTARSPLSTFSQDELSAIRMIVEGRLQDFGPVTVPEEETILPPDYSQATEPLPGQPGSDRSV
ncbi:hypothetical protein NCC49_004492 [Naganishia albida]|nr:hypothetical protein NCC49_004492 [Naganishia albida]